MHRIVSPDPPSGIWIPRWPRPGAAIKQTKNFAENKPATLEIKLYAGQKRAASSPKRETKLTRRSERLRGRFAEAFSTQRRNA
jgi:hypothetical protein